MVVLEGEKLFEYLSKLEREIKSLSGAEPERAMHELMANIVNEQMRFLRVRDQSRLDFHANGLPRVESLDACLSEKKSSGEIFPGLEGFDRRYFTKTDEPEKYTQKEIVREDFDKRKQGMNGSSNPKVSWSIRNADGGKLELSLRRDIYVDGVDEFSQNVPVLSEERTTKYNIVWNQIFTEFKQKFYRTEILPEKKEEKDRAMEMGEPALWRRLLGAGHNFWRLEGIEYNGKVWTGDLYKGRLCRGKKKTYDEWKALSDKARKEGGFYTPDFALLYGILKNVSNMKDVETRERIRDMFFGEDDLMALTKTIHEQDKNDRIIHSEGTEDEFNCEARQEMTQDHNCLAVKMGDDFSRAIFGSKDEAKDIFRVFGYLGIEVHDGKKLNLKTIYDEKIATLITWYQRSMQINANTSCNEKLKSIGVRLHR